MTFLLLVVYELGILLIFLVFFIIVGELPCLNEILFPDHFEMGGLLDFLNRTHQTVVDQST